MLNEEYIPEGIIKEFEKGGKKHPNVLLKNFIRKLSQKRIEEMETQNGILPQKMY